jgi:hypothetical protein
MGPSGKIASTLAADGTMNVISLDRARDRLRGARLRGPRRIEPPSALAVPVRTARPAHDADDGEDRLRMRQNLAAFLVIVAIVGVGAWLMDSLHYHSRLQTCVEAGHRNCLPLAAEYMASPYGR